MRPQRPLASVLALLCLPIVASAQTAEIQREIETRLWFQRVLAWIEEATGVPPAVAIATLIAVFLALLAMVWLWRARPRAADE